MKRKRFITNQEYLLSLTVDERIRFVNEMYDTGKAHKGWLDEQHNPESKNPFVFLAWFFYIGTFMCGISGLVASLIMLDIRPIEELLGTYAGFMFGMGLFSLLGLATERYIRYCEKWGVGK